MTDMETGETPSTRSENADPAFEALSRGLLISLVKAAKPERFHSVRIKKYFDHKWLRFAGKKLVAFEGCSFIDTAYDWAWREGEHLTLPPFNPSRVEEVRSFERASGEPSGYAEREPARLHVRQESPRNLQRRIAGLGEGSALYAWRSAVEPGQDMASFMAYSRRDGRNGAWFASFRKDAGAWMLNQAKGIALEGVERLMGA
jgi:hypothetical protein